MWAVGYYGDYGQIYDNNPSGSYGTNRTYGLGDTVGCSVDYSAGGYIFALNGEVICRSC